MKPEVSIIYSCRNISEDLLDSIKTISSGIGKTSYEIIIVSNEIHRLKNIGKYKNLKIVKNNDFFQAKGKFILMVRKGILFAPFSIEKMLSRIKNNNEIGIVTPMVLGPDNMIAGNKSLLFSILTLKYKFPNFDSNKEQFVDILKGDCMLIPKDLFEKINGFDGKFFHIYIQIILCIKIRKQGYKNLYYPDAKVLNFYLSRIS